MLRGTVTTVICTLREYLRSNASLLPTENATLSPGEAG